jgi:hypothetical protein
MCRTLQKEQLSIWLRKEKTKDGEKNRIGTSPWQNL